MVCTGLCVAAQCMGGVWRRFPEACTPVPSSGAASGSSVESLDSSLSDTGTVSPAQDGGPFSEDIPWVPSAEAGVTGFDDGASADGADATSSCDTSPLFAYPTLESLPSLVVGSWIYRGGDGSLFSAPGVPRREIGVVFRSDMTWSRLVQDGNSYVALTDPSDSGTWSTSFSGGCGPTLWLSWSGGQMAVVTEFSAGSMLADNSAGNQLLMVRLSAQ